MHRYALRQMRSGHPNSQAVFVLGGGRGENNVYCLQDLHRLDWDKVRIAGADPDTVQGALLM
jgi:hypothetical protein